MARDSYRTKTREIVNEEIKNYPNGFIVKELKSDLDKKGVNIGLTTIYRTLDLLEADMMVTKFYDENNIAHYKYVNDCQSETHFYLKCQKCDKIYHVDCSCMDDLGLHILKQHKFKIDTKNIILEGLCNNCRSFIKL